MDSQGYTPGVIMPQPRPQPKKIDVLQITAGVVAVLGIITLILWLAKVWPFKENDTNESRDTSTDVENAAKAGNPTTTAEQPSQEAPKYGETEPAKPAYDPVPTSWQQLVMHDKWNAHSYWDESKKVSSKDAVDRHGRPTSTFESSWTGKTDRRGAFFFGYYGMTLDNKPQPARPGRYKAFFKVRTSQRTTIHPYICSMTSPAEERAKGFGWLPSQTVPAGFDGTLQFDWDYDGDAGLDPKHCGHLSFRLDAEKPKEPGSATLHVPVVYYQPYSATVVLDKTKVPSKTTYAATAGTDRPDF